MMPSSTKEKKVIRNYFMVSKKNFFIIKQEVNAI
jgi:hypothetical protein